MRITKDANNSIRLCELHRIDLINKLREYSKDAHGLPADRKPINDHLRMIERELNEAYQLLHQYRTKTPLGNQPHMIIEAVDNWLRRNQRVPTSGVYYLSADSGLVFQNKEDAGRVKEVYVDGIRFSKERPFVIQSSASLCG